MSGTVESLREQAAPLETARLKAVHVIVGQEVRAGQLLVEMDTSILDAELVMEKLQEDRRFASAMADVETALQDTLIRQAEAYGAVNKMFCARATSEILRSVPGFETLPHTFSPLKLSDAFGKLPGAVSEMHYDNDPDDNSGVLMVEIEKSRGAERRTNAR